MRNQVIRDLLRQDWFAPAVIFDVGANVGQSAQEFSASFPNAKILSFEPVAASYAALELLVQKLGNVEALRLALGDKNGELTMTAHGTSTANHVVSKPRNGVTESVRAQTGDDFCKDRSIGRIDLLKIDTEGHDLNVLMGFAAMMKNRQVALVQVECGFAPENRYHASFDAVNEILYPLEYRLWGIYGLTRRLGRAQTRGAMYGDAVYISPE